VAAPLNAKIPGAFFCLLDDGFGTSFGKTTNSRLPGVEIPQIPLEIEVHSMRSSHPDGVDAVLDLVHGSDAIRRDAEILKSGRSLVSTLYAADGGWFAQRQITAQNTASTRCLISTNTLHS
jgi:hypothetical protein